MDRKSHPIFPSCSIPKLRKKNRAYHLWNANNLAGSWCADFTIPVRLGLSFKTTHLKITESELKNPTDEERLIAIVEKVQYFKSCWLWQKLSRCLLLMQLPPCFLLQHSLMHGKSLLYWSAKPIHLTLIPLEELLLQCLQEASWLSHLLYVSYEKKVAHLWWWKGLSVSTQGHNDIGN